MSAPQLKVVTLHESSLRDISARLRKLADEIEAGAYGQVSCAGAVLMGARFECFGWGDGINGDSAGPSAALLFSAAVLRITKGIEAHGA